MVKNGEAGIDVSQDNHTEVYGNTVENNTKGIGLYQSENDSIHNNTVSSNEKGIVLKPESGYESGIGMVYVPCKNNAIERNDITGNDIGVYTTSNENETEGNNAINYNNMVNNTSYGVQNDGIGTLDATNNWWGTTTESEIKGMVSGDVDYSSWGTESFDTEAPTFDSQSPADGTFTNDNQQVITVDISDAKSDVDSTTISVTVSDSDEDYLTSAGIEDDHVSYNTGTLTIDPDSGTAWVYDEDTIDVSVDVNDSVGNSGSTTWSFTTDYTAPSIESATTVQAGAITGDSIIDVVFTEAGSGLDPTTIDPADFSVGGTTLDDVVDSATVSGTTVTLTYNASTDDVSALDTGETPDVDMVETLKDLVGNQQTSAAAGSVTPSDGIAPVIDSGSYKDTDGDGTVDQVELVFSETITYSSYEDDDWTVAANSLTDLDVSGGTATNSSALQLTASAQENLTGADGGQPSVAFNDRGSTDVGDGSGNTLADGASVTLSDAASPLIYGAGYYDTNSDGQVDHVIMTYTETIDEGTYTDTSATISGISGASLSTGSVVTGDGATISPDAGPSDKYITLGISSAPQDNTAYTSVTLDTNGSAMVSDGTNDAVDQPNVTASDKASPLVVEFEAQQGSWKATVKFSEGVYTETGGTGALTAGDFIYSDISAGDAGNVTSASHVAGENMAVVALDAQATSSDIGMDGIHATIYDLAGNGTFDLMETGDGTAEWSTTEAHSGSYSVLLTATNPDSASVGIPVDLPLADITQLSFRYNHKEHNPADHILGPDMDLVLNAGGNYYVAGRGGAVESSGAWSEANLIDGTNFAGTSKCFCVQVDAELNIIEDLGYYDTFGNLKAEDALSGATVLHAAVNLDPPGKGGSGSVYVDDITVNDTTYDLEATTVMADARNALSLENGWNLVSIPKVASADWNIWDSVENVELIYIYDEGGWHQITTENNVKSLDGVAIKANGPQELALSWTTSGMAVPPTEELEVGWNLIGTNMDPSEFSVSVDIFLHSVTNSWSTLFSPDFNLNPWTVTSGEDITDVVLPYEGYWIYMEQQDTLAGRTT